MTVAMMNITGSDLMGILVVAGIFVIPAIAGGLATLLKHRQKMRKLQAENRDEDERIRALEKRVKELEKLCAKLDERVTDAHVLLADEQRELDSKLNAMLPPLPQDSDESDKKKHDKKHAERVR